MKSFEYLKRLLLLTTLTLVVCVSTSHGVTEVVTNLDLLKQMTTDVADELTAQFSEHLHKGSITIHTPKLDEKYQFISNVFTGVLTSRGYRVYSTARTAAGADSGSVDIPTGEKTVRIEIQMLQFNLTYPKIYRSHLIGGKRVKRKADIKLYAELIDPVDEAVIWVGEAGQSHEDQFPYHLTSRVEEGIYAFTKPAHEGIKWSKIVEPVVVSGIIVGLIYLFFSNQSAD